MQPWTEALLKRLSSGSVHAGVLLNTKQIYGDNDVRRAKLMLTMLV